MTDEVTVRTYRRAREILGTKELTRHLDPGADVSDLLAELAKAYALDPAECIVMVNGRNVNHLQGSRTGLSDGDVVAIAVDPSPD